LDEDAGDGSDGAYAPTTSDTLTAGTYQFTSVDLDGVQVGTDGDVTLRISGAFSMTNSARLQSTGALRIVVDGPFDIGAGSSFFEANGGELIVDQLSTDGVNMGNVLVRATTVGAVPADLSVSSRGSITFDSVQGYNEWDAGATATTRGGDTILCAYGDIVVQNLTRFDTLGTATAARGTGIWLQSEGDIVVQGTSAFLPDFGPVELRAAGAIRVLDLADVHSVGGPLDIIADGPVVFDTEALVRSLPGDGPRPITIRGASLTMGEYAVLQTTNSFSGFPVGEITIEVSGDATMDLESLIIIGDSDCGDGGDVTVRAGGNVSLTQDSMIYAGEDGGSTCPGVGGDVLIEAGGSIAATGTGGPYILPGAGFTSPGTVTESPGASVTVEPDAGVRPTISVESNALPVNLAGRTITDVSVGAVDGLDSWVSVWVDPDGSGTWVAPADAVGQVLVDGWRYRVDLGQRMFDGSGLDELSVAY